MTLLQRIKLFLSALFNAAKKAYYQLTPEQQAALQNGSGIISIITMGVNDLPAAVREAIIKKFPDLPLQKLESGLFEIAQAFNLVSKNENSLEDLIELLQKHFKSLQGKSWAAIAHAAAALLAVLLAPAGTEFSAISSLLEWVYQTFIKKSVTA